MIFTYIEKKKTAVLFKLFKLTIYLRHVPINISKRNTVETFCGQLLLSFPEQNRTYPVWRFGILEGSLFNECVTGLTSVLSVAPHNGEDEGQLIMYSVPVLWACCIMVRHKRSLCARLPPEPSHIPELLLDTAVPLSEEAPVSPTAPRPPDLPEDPIDMSDQAGESSAPRHRSSISGA